MTSTIRSEVGRQRFNLLRAIEEAPTEPALISIWNNPAAQAIWTDDHTAAATARKQVLS